MWYHMQTRPLGDTGHDSSILTFGAIALDFIPQDEADALVDRVVDAGVNHFDVAPSYGEAEVKLAPKLGEYRDEVFLGCKTEARTYDGARAELEQSLERLDVEKIDLYQFHAVTRESELETILDGDDGALAAFRDARDEGLVDHIGLTSHGNPALVRDAVERIDDLATVMFPMNAVVAGKGDPDHDYASVLELAAERGLGTLGIKTFAKGPWPDDLAEEDRPYNTWYEPYDEEVDIVESLRFSLSQGLTTITNAGDPALVPAILDAAQNFEPMDDDEQAVLVSERTDETSPVPTR